MKRFVAAILLAIAALGCARRDRPEGFVERWLIATGQGTAGNPDQYARKELTNSIAPLPREPGALEVIEVGRGEIEVNNARVPFRVQRSQGDAVSGIAELELTSTGWRIVALAPADPALRVPSRGGDHIGRASSVVWLGAVLAALALMLVTTGLMRLTPET